MYDSVDKVFSDGMPKRFNTEYARGKKRIYQFIIRNCGEWHADINDGDLKVYKGKVENPDCTISMYKDDYLDMVNGVIGNQMAFMTGKLSINGDLVAALELSYFFPPDPQ